MHMIYYELTIYIKNKKKALCTALFESKASLENFIASLSSDLELIRLGEIIFKKEDFYYAEIKRRTKHGKNKD